MVKAIVFDCFGVLATDGWLPFKEEFFSRDKELYAKATDLNKQANSGLLNYGDFVHQIGGMVGRTDAEIRSQFGHNVPNVPLFTYIRETLKPHYKLGILSNASENWLDTIFTKDQIALFDAIVLSYQVGMVKPDIQMYQLIAQKLATPLYECIFIDDQQTYCSAANTAGMQSICYQNFDQAKTELERILAK